MLGGKGRRRGIGGRKKNRERSIRYSEYMEEEEREVENGKGKLERSRRDRSGEAIKK